MAAVLPRWDSATHFDSCARQLYVLAVRVRRAPFCGGIHDNAAPRESECSRTDPPLLPSQHGESSSASFRVVSTSVVRKCHLNGVLVCTPFSAAFTLKHRECKQVSARRLGGLLLRRSAPTGSRFLPLRGHPPRKQTLALGSCLTLAPSGWRALRDSGHQRRFFHV
jgi:hypothetical protein